MTLPDWLGTLAAALPGIRGEQLGRLLPPREGARRQAAVLALFGAGPEPDLLLIERAATMRSHAGQPAFPGGRIDPGDDGPVGAALREAQEEVGLDPASVEVLGTLPELWLPPSGFAVTPVVGWWRDPHPVRVVDAAEVASVVRVPVARLTDPEHRWTVTHPSGYVGPAFDTGDLLVWGFTAGVLDRLLAFAGWERPWDATRTRELPADVVALALASSPAYEPVVPEADRTGSTLP
ncbi:MAG TPA: CoA pyrophosphatase [Mycobacteriales bacterium]|nr:CoA pyrophosphatase [Mycobacteriales bacterium]